ncbi:uncharacterized protein LOC144243918 isoform X2 [Crocuta crocuta]
MQPQGRPWMHQNVSGVLGICDLQGYSCRLHAGRVGPAGHVPEEAVQRCDAGEHWSSGVCGVSTLQVRCDFPVAARSGAVEGRERISPRPDSGHDCGQPVIESCCSEI